MPYYSFKKIWTSMEIFGIKLFKEIPSGALWYQVKKNKKHPLFKKSK